MRRLMTVLLLSSVLACGVVVGGCGSSSSSGSHHIFSKVLCAGSVYLAYRDVKEHRLGWAAFQAVLAHHNCHEAFSRPY